MATNYNDNNISDDSNNMPTGDKNPKKDNVISDEVIERNFKTFRSYIETCVKVTDLIAFYDLFTTGRSGSTFFSVLSYEPRYEKIGFFAYAKTKTQISFAVTAKLIRAFVFAKYIVQSLYFLYPKFQASSHLL